MLKRILIQKNNLSSIQLLFACLTVFTLPFSKGLPNVFLFTSLFFLLLERKKLVYKPIIPISIFVGTFFLINIANSTFITDFSSLSKYLIIIILAFVLINSKTIAIKKSYVIGVNLTILISAIKILSLYITHENVDLSNGDTIFSVIFSDRPFWGFLIFISSCVTIALFKCKEISKKVALTLIIINITYVFFIAARLTMLTYLIGTFLYFFAYSHIKLHYKIIISLSLITGFYFVSTINDNIKNRFKFDKGVEIFIDNEPRFIIWPCSAEIIKSNNNWITGGLSYDSTIQKLSDCYSNTINNPKKKDWYLESKYNTHNQFLFYMMNTGILGILAFLYFLYTLSMQINSFEKLAVIIGFVLFLTLDCILYRQIGTYFTGLIIMLIYTNENKTLTN